MATSTPAADEFEAFSHTDKLAAERPNLKVTMAWFFLTGFMAGFWCAVAWTFTAFY